METIVKDTYQLMSKQAAEDILQLMQPVNHPVICTASGDTPAGLYMKLVDLFNTKNIDMSGWSFVGLDEWGGMNGDDEGSCRYHLNKQLFNHLNVHDHQICFFDGRKDLEEECQKVEAYIQQHEGIDVAILGLGMNGHIGMNEPGTSASLRSHVADIDPVTQKVGQKYFKQPVELSKGVTLGIATLLEAKHIILLVSGAHKAEIVHRILNEEVSEDLPATLLRDHPGLKIYLDGEAARLVKG